MRWSPVCYAKETFAVSRIFFNENKPLIILLSIIAVFFFLLWKFGSESLSNFGLNAFTETVGIIITVFLVDHIIKNQEQRRLRPLQVAAFSDVQSFVGRLAAFWITVYNWSGKDELPPLPPPPSTQEFLTMPYFEEIRKRLNLDANACVFPKRTWWEYLPQVEDEFRKRGEKILERHAAVLDPQAYHLVYKVLNGFLDKNIGFNNLAVMRQIGGFLTKEDQERLPQQCRHRLAYFWFLPEERLKEFADLYEWYRKNIKLYLGHD